jgi:arsenate reductase (thioredoxin)
MTTVLFACVHNAGRSQMAAAFFNAMSDPARARAVSAGTEPADHVHPEVVSAMRESGIDLSAATPQRLTDDLARRAHILVTMGCGETCPVIPGLRQIDWTLDDPKALGPAGVRRVRDQVKTLVGSLIESERLGPPPAA